MVNYLSFRTLAADRPAGGLKIWRSGGLVDSSAITVWRSNERFRSSSRALRISRPLRRATN